MKFGNKILLLVSLFLCLVSVIFAGSIQTDFGKVEMSEISIESEYGTLTGYMFRPKTATSKSPAPAVVCNHGYLNNREMQDEVYIELSRRGYVVISMESYGHGDSDVASKDADPNSPLIKSNGMVAFVEYLYSLDYVDKAHIGVTGHSMGGNFSAYTTYYYSQQLVNKIDTCVVVGNYPTILLSDDAAINSFNAHTSVILAQYDEFFYDNGVGMLSSDNTKELIKNYGGGNVECAEEGKTYGNLVGGLLADKTISFYNPKQFHATNHFSSEVTKYIITEFEKWMPTDTKLEPTNQVWFLKEVFNLIGLIGFFMFVIPFLDLLLQLPFFKTIKKDVLRPEKLEKDEKKKFIKRNILSGFFCFLVTLPALGLGYLLLQNVIWPQDTTGGVAIWCLVCGLIVLGYQKKAFGKKIRKNKEEYGIKIDLGNFLKTLLLAFLVVLGTYSLVFIADGINQTDFRFWTFDIRVFNFSKAFVALRYLPFFGFFYIISGFACARASFKNWSQLKQIIVMGLVNIIAPALFLFVCYFPTVFMQKIVWAGIPGVGAAFALMAVIMIPFVPILFISSIISVKSYRLSGNMWLGGLINTLLITMITVANTSFSVGYLLM